MVQEYSVTQVEPTAFDEVGVNHGASVFVIVDDGGGDFETPEDIFADENERGCPLN